MQIMAVTNPVAGSASGPPTIAGAATDPASLSAAPAVAGPRTVLGPNPSLRLDPALSLVVIQFYGTNGKVIESIPSAAQLAAYRAQAESRPPHGFPTAAAPADGAATADSAARATPAPATQATARAPASTPAAQAAGSSVAQPQAQAGQAAADVFA
jgi:hypothetical protein